MDRIQELEKEVSNLEDELLRSDEDLGALAIQKDEEMVKLEDEICDLNVELNELKREKHGR